MYVYNKQDNNYYFQINIIVNKFCNLRIWQIPAAKCWRKDIGILQTKNAVFIDADKHYTPVLLHAGI